MQEIFNNDFYAIEEGDQKPVFPEDDELVGGKKSLYNLCSMISIYIFYMFLDDWDNWKGEQDDYAPHCEDDDFNVSFYLERIF